MKLVFVGTTVVTDYNKKVLLTNLHFVQTKITDVSKLPNIGKP